MMSPENARTIFVCLMSHLNEIKEEVEKVGRWQLPDIVKTELHSIVTEGKLTPEEYQKICLSPEEEKSDFPKDPFFLDVFCRLKIHEIRWRLCCSNQIQHNLSREAVTLHVLSFWPDLEHPVRVTTAALSFDANEAGSVRGCMTSDTQTYSDIVIALQASDFLRSTDKQTVLRFSDHPIEKNLVVADCGGKIDYFSIRQIKDSQGEGTNFWEQIAAEKKSFDYDPDEIEVVTKRFPQHPYHTITLAPEISKMAQLGREIDQQPYIQQVIAAQQAGFGSLIYLPTGFGKTFIMLLAMAQHYRNLEADKRKPYLLVLPPKATNVEQAWIDNITVFLEREKNLRDSDPGFFAFGQEFKAVIAENNKTEIKEDENNATCVPKKLLSQIAPGISDKKTDYQLVIVRGQKFTAFVNTQLLGKGKKKQSRESNLGFLNEEQIEILKRSGILSGESFITSYIPGRDNAEAWKKQIQSTLTSLSVDVERANAKSRRKKNDVSLALYAGDLSVTERYDKFLGKGGRTRQRISETDESVLYEHLAKQAELQRKNSSQLTSFMQLFNGILLDESQSILGSLQTSGKKESKESSENKEDTLDNTCSIVMQIARFFGSQNAPQRVTNRFMLAASATPWPNNMKEVQRHFQFLAPHIMQDHSLLNRKLFSCFSKLEEATKCAIQGKTNSDSENSDHDGIIHADSKLSMNEALKKVQDDLKRWTNLFVQHLVICSKETENSAQKGNDQTNKMTEHFIFLHDPIPLLPTNQEDDEQDEETTVSSSHLQCINRFYNQMLYPSDSLVLFEKQSIKGRRKLGLAKSENFDRLVKSIFDDKKYAPVLQEAFALLTQLKDPYAKIAFYVQGKKEAIYLKSLLVPLPLNDLSM